MSAALLASEIPSDVAGWWVSEKLDGVRAIWTGTALLSRHGKPLNAPAWFTASLPADIRLDGELWMGRGTFDALLSKIQRKGGDWSGVEFHVFDVQVAGTFEDRQSALCRPFPSHVKPVPHLELSGHEALDAMEANIVANGGEGCVIRRPGSPYRPGRVGDVVKIKRLVADVDRWQG
jgi:DNA ligase 1